MKFSTLITGKAFKRSFLAAAVAACTSSAYALPPQFTFDPTAFCPTCIASPFDANNVIISDYAKVTTASDGTFSENGYLQVSGFQLGTTNFTPTGLNAMGGYSLYISFTTTGHTTFTSSDFTRGVFDTVSYSFIGAPGAVSGGTTPNAGEVVLATGSLINDGTGKTTLDISGTSLSPNAHANVTFIPVFNAFFKDPVPFYNVALTTFDNTSSEVTAFSGGFNVVQGGGSLNFEQRAEVPEPTTVALLAIGLLGFALRKRKQS